MYPTVWRKKKIIGKMNFSQLFVLLNFFLLHLCIFQQANAMVGQFFYSHFIFRCFNLLTLFAIMQNLQDIQILRSEDCTPNDKKYPARIENLEIKFSKNDSFLATGQLLITDKLPMNIELDVSLTRCNLDQTGCLKYGSINYPRICEKSSVKTSVAYQIASGIHPIPKCPVQPGIYEIKNDSKFLLHTFLSLPTDGYLWKAKLIFYEKRGLKRVRPLACFSFDLISNSKRTRM